MDYNLDIYQRVFIVHVMFSNWKEYALCHWLIKKLLLCVLVFIRGNTQLIVWQKIQLIMKQIWRVMFLSKKEGYSNALKYTEQNIDNQRLSATNFTKYLGWWHLKSDSTKGILGLSGDCYFNHGLNLYYILYSFHEFKV